MSGHIWSFILSSALLLPVSLFNTAYASNDRDSPIVINTIRLGEKGWENGSPSSVVVNPTTNTVYVANRNSDTIVVLDGASYVIPDIISVDNGPVDMVLNPNTEMLYVVNGYPQTVSVIDVATNSVIATIELTQFDNVDSLNAIAVNTETNKLYLLIVGGTEAFIAIIDGMTNKVDEIFKISDLPPDYDVGRVVRDIAINSDTNMIYVTRDFDSVLVIDGSNNQVVETISVEGPTTIAVNEKTNTIYSGNFFSQSISIIDGSDNTIVETLEQIEPQRIEVDEQTNTIYISGYGGLTVVDGESRQVKDHITTGEFSEGVALNPNTGLLYVANARDNSVSVIQTHHESEWKTVYAVGKFSYTEPRKSDQIFKIQYRAVNGTIDTVAAKFGFSGNINAADSGLLEIKYPRNYPYTNSESNEFVASPIMFIDGVEVSEVTPAEITDCFFVFSIPFSGSAEFESVELAWPYLAVERPFHGDEVPEHCIPETIVENVVVKNDGTISPYHQYKAGVKAQDVMCEGDLEPKDYRLVVHPDGRPFCVMRESATDLIQRWGVTISA